MKKLAIYGAGGFGKETELLVRQINFVQHVWQFIGFFDDNILTELGGIRELNKYPDELHVVVAIANSRSREAIVNKITNKRIKWANLIHPNAIISKRDVRLGQGCIICANTVMTSDIKLGNHVIINLSCTIGHDVAINDFCALMPGTHISGNVKIGAKTLIGSGSVILQNLAIGKQSTIGAGAVITKDVKANTTVVGVPGREL